MQPSLQWISRAFPAPDVIEKLDFETILADAVATESTAGVLSDRAVHPKGLKSAIASWLNDRVGEGPPSAFTKALLTPPRRQRCTQWPHCQSGTGSRGNHNHCDRAEPQGDVAFLLRLGREHDAVATVKDGNLIFARKGAGTATNGKASTQLEILRRYASNHSWQRQTRKGQDGVTASWHDRGKAKRQPFTVGEKKRSKRLHKIYADETSARRAAVAERDRLKRAPTTLDFILALGRPDATPEARITVSGFEDEIDAPKWLIIEVRHRPDKRGGFLSSVKMETG